MKVSDENLAVIKIQYLENKINMLEHNYLLLKTLVDSISNLQKNHHELLEVVAKNLLKERPKK